MHNRKRIISTIILFQLILSSSISILSVEINGQSNEGLRDVIGNVPIISLDWEEEHFIIPTGPGETGARIYNGSIVVEFPDNSLPNEVCFIVFSYKTNSEEINVSVSPPMIEYQKDSNSRPVNLNIKTNSAMISSVNIDTTFFINCSFEFKLQNGNGNLTLGIYDIELIPYSYPFITQKIYEDGIPRFSIGYWRTIYFDISNDGNDVGSFTIEVISASKGVEYKLRYKSVQIIEGGTTSVPIDVRQRWGTGGIKKIIVEVNGTVGPRWRVKEVDLRFQTQNSPLTLFIHPLTYVILNMVGLSGVIILLKIRKTKKLKSS